MCHSNYVGDADEAGRDNVVISGLLEFGEQILQFGDGPGTNE